MSDGESVGQQPQSICSPGFAPLLSSLGLSLAVTGYQSGKLLLFCADGDTLNSRYRDFARPTGLALRGRRLAIGTQQTIQEFHDHPAVAAKLEPAGLVDACYLPLAQRSTGDIEVHEMGYAADGRLWFVNTRFSALCTLSDDYSFEVQWRPPFISALAPEDRCHLNGLGFVDDRPALATSLGHGDSECAWRAQLLDGGVLMDVPSNRVIADGLCLPHSPRRHDGRLWLLNSGQGQLATVDRDSGRLEVIAELPGFTRGLDFFGPYAFVGLSKVRDLESITGQLPISERGGETLCGIWVIDIRNGETVAWLRFTQVVTTLFEVRLLPGQRFPELLTDSDERGRFAFLMPPQAVCESMDGEDPAVLLESAKAHHRSGEPDRAEALYRRSLAMNPDQVEARLLFSRLLQDSGRHGEAIEVIEQAVALRPDSADLLEVLGMTQASAGRLEEAAISWGRVVLLDAERAETWQALGRVLCSLDRSPEAVVAFDRALALRPDHLPALIGRGDALFGGGRLDAALESYQLAMQRVASTDAGADSESGEESPSGLAKLHARIGETLQGLGRLEEAATELERAVALQPEFIAAHNRLGNIYRDRGDGLRASECFDRVVQLTPDATQRSSNSA